jgi:hypothetical protein
MSNVTGASFNAVAGKSYIIRAIIIYSSSAAANGLGIAITTPAGTLNATCHIPYNTIYGMIGSLTGSGTIAQSGYTPTLGVTTASVFGVFTAAASGVVQLQARNEVVGTIIICAGTMLIAEEL